MNEFHIIIIIIITRITMFVSYLLQVVTWDKPKVHIDYGYHLINNNYKVNNYMAY